MTTTVVHLLRHGEVDNPGGVLYGRLPGFGLSERGVRMAQAAADALAGRPIRYLVSSPLQRARETAAPVAERLGLDVAIDDRLIEPTNVFEGLSFAAGDGALRRPDLWRYLYDPFRPSWGEPYREIADRVCAVVGEVRDRVRGAEAVCVSHQLPIYVARRAVEGRPLWHHPAHRQCGLASITSFTYRDDDIVSVTYSEPAGAASRLPAKGA